MRGKNLLNSVAYDKLKIMTTKLEERKIEAMVEKTVYRVLRGVFIDPDTIMELKPSFEKKLKQSIKEKQLGKLKDLRTTLASLHWTLTDWCPMTGRSNLLSGPKRILVVYQPDHKLKTIIVYNIGRRDKVYKP